VQRPTELDYSVLRRSSPYLPEACHVYAYRASMSVPIDTGTDSYDFNDITHNFPADYALYDIAASSRLDIAQRLPRNSLHLVRGLDQQGEA